jgi:hypothetical protein
MEGWWNPDARHRIAIDVHDPLAAGREAEPVEVTLHFDVFRPREEGLRVVDDDGRIVPSQIVAKAVGNDGRLDFAKLCFLVDLRAPRGRFFVYLSDAALPGSDAGGIAQLSTRLDDGVRRLDTGTYEIELCRGTAGGHGGSKWGIRHFEHKAQGINLIKDNMNAFGGVYGPFFTPENGLVNPPAHTLAEISPITEGPVVCEYRMTVAVPDGLRPELRGKTLDIRWRFYNRSPWFVRSYFPDDYETVIDGRACRNRITVGDELESGRDHLLLSAFKQYGGTHYRSGDLYHSLFLDHIADLTKRHPGVVREAAEKLGIAVDEDPRGWGWDSYWRLFSVREQAMPTDLLKDELQRLGEQANRLVWADSEHSRVRHTLDFIDVSQEPQQSIYPLNVQKTCEYSPGTGYAFIRYVNRRVDRIDVIQRRETGWVNWGTNGENEYPELPAGSTIWSAYGRFDDWEREVDRMETPLALAIGPLERFYPL